MSLKDTLLSLADNPKMREFVVQNKLTRGVSRRFVAGEVLDDAIQATRMMNKKSIQTALDLLGENVSSEAEARASTQDYINAIQLIHKTGIDANISIKLTALGLDISRELCLEQLFQILEQAKQANIFVCIDMEGSAYTAQTIEIALAAKERFEQVGTVVQSYLYRTQSDLEKLIEQKVRVRLVKGAYKEPENVAFQQKSSVDQNYLTLMKMLLARGNFPAIATHDEVIIDAACAYVRDHGISKTSFEFQMLYGIRRDLQEKLVQQGYNVRVYVPYGSQWYPYLMRRMAERPANLIFVVSNMWR
ncbi:proline dehydrogenase family protein [Tengunoibacter tsumagoiensis]|uniref:proline dehydrogenase n=1 Tax=Tengunoibacter tsumagoiensis TaxID=2014871 RepID=A0A402A5N3_9CHLR|nr:proline dehydrogenase family protein [Tengunoibacter tsumagoiensis]GCE14335.1 proline dehydrogenase [Tengunoibacter tsumagoiensis]